MGSSPRSLALARESVFLKPNRRAALADDTTTPNSRIRSVSSGDMEPMECPVVSCSVQTLPYSENLRKQLFLMIKDTHLYCSQSQEEILRELPSRTPIRA